MTDILGLSVFRICRFRTGGRCRRSAEFTVGCDQPGSEGVRTGRYDRYGDVLSPARRGACDTTCESYFDDRRTAFDRYSSREGIRCDCNLRSGARDSGERPIPENTWEVPSMRRRVFRSGRSATGTRGGLPTRRCTRSRWREQVGCGRVIPKLYRAIGCLRRFRAGSHWSGSAQSQQNAHRRTDSRRTIRGGGGICVPDDCRGICCGGDPQPVAGGYRVVPYSKKAISFIRRATFIPFYS